MWRCKTAGRRWRSRWFEKARGLFEPREENGDLVLLAEFVLACPKSIQDVTVRGETAMHIAVRKKIVEAVEILVGLLERACYENAAFWEAKILNFKDENGDTALHIAASTNQLQVIELPIKNQSRH